MRPPHPMPAERQTALWLNGIELLRIQTTPVDLEDWALGFLFCEALIDGPADLQAARVDAAVPAVHAAVDPTRAPDVPALAARYRPRGPGPGATFDAAARPRRLLPVTHRLTVTRGQLAGWMRRMQAATPLYAATGGMHAAAVVHVATGGLLVREDIGRHNAVDKVLGAWLRAGWPAEEVVLLATGRISHEMCCKVARARIGVAASLSAATDEAIRLADALAIDLAGYAKSPDRLVVYTAGGRIR